MTEEEYDLEHLRHRVTRASSLPFKSLLMSEAEQAVMDAAVLLADADRLRNENAALREIVQAVADSDPETSFEHGLVVGCYYCRVEREWPESGELVLPHADDCPWVKARAILAESKGSDEVQRLRDQLADMARSTIIAFALEVSSDDPTIEKAKQILRDLGREDEIPDY